MESSPITSWQIEGEKVEAMTDFLFLGSKISADSDCNHEIKGRLLLGRKAMTNLAQFSSVAQSCLTLCNPMNCSVGEDKPRHYVKKQGHHFADKGPYSQSDDFSSSHIRMWELDHKEGWAPKNWCFQILVLEKTLDSPLDRKIKPVHPKGNQA